MNRHTGFCPCCEQITEWYSDHLTPPGSSYRCGNCFQGVNEDELAKLGKVHADLVKLDAQRQATLLAALKR